MTATKLARRKSDLRVLLNDRALTNPYSIIQDCEEALTNWVQQNAAVSAKLSTRARTLSQRRRSRARQAEGVDLSGQDQPLEGRESGLWIPASEHQGNGYGEEEEEVTHSVTSENRGREEERAVPA